MKTIAEKTAEIVETNTRLGWYENCATFPEAMALLHSEVSEALEAWRKWGLADVTKKHEPGSVGSLDEVYNGPPKPEGVGSEFADIYIRLLDDCYLFCVDLNTETWSCGLFGVSESFPANMNTLHDMISRASMAWEADDWPDEEGSRGGWTWRHQFGCILVFLQQLCSEYGIDLEAEYERKMAFNRTRPWRHANKRI